MFVQDQTHSLPVLPEPAGSVDPNSSLQEEQETREDLAKELTIYKDFLPEKRNKLVEGLAIIDTLLAVRDSIRENTSHTAIACSARSDKIVKDWNEYVRENAVAREWWAAMNERESEVRDDTAAADDIPLSPPTHPQPSSSPYLFPPHALPPHHPHQHVTHPPPQPTPSQNQRRKPSPEQQQPGLY